MRAARLAMQQTASGSSEFQALHVGTGHGHSVKQVIERCELVLGKPVPFVMHGRRPGDVAALVADPSRLAQVLDLHPDADLQRMVRDAAQSLGLIDEA